MLALDSGDIDLWITPNPSRTPVKIELGQRMSDFSVGTILVSIREDSGVFTDSPGHGEAVEEGTYSHVMRFESRDGWVGEFAVVDFPKKGTKMGRFIWTGGNVVQPYTSLNKAGNTGINPMGEYWVCPIRAMKVRGKPHPTLNSVTLEELDEVLGSSFEEFLSGFGECHIAQYGSLYPPAGKQVKNGLGLAMNPNNLEVLAAMIAVTRPLALLKGL